MVQWTLEEGQQLLAEMVALASEFSWIYDFHGTQVCLFLSVLLTFFYLL